MAVRSAKEGDVLWYAPWVQGVSARQFQQVEGQVIFVRYVVGVSGMPSAVVKDLNGLVKVCAVRVDELYKNYPERIFDPNR